MPVLSSSTSSPVLVSTLSARPSPSVSAFLGLVPVLVALTKDPVLVSTPSLSPSPSVSALVGSVLVSSYSSRSVNPSPSKSPVPDPGPGPPALPFKSSRLSTSFSSQISGSPSSSLSLVSINPRGLLPPARVAI